MMRNNRPVNQDFIWFAEYADGIFLYEFDLESKKENGFYDINKSDIIRFGLIGHGNRAYFEVYGGVYKINGQMYEVLYRTKDREYHLTGHRVSPYNDIIQYKDAETLIDLYSEKHRSFGRITKFNIGYKKKLQLHGININFKSIFSIPHQSNPYLSMRIVADRDLNGEIVIRKNNREIDSFAAPLGERVGGEIHWNIR